MLRYFAAGVILSIAVYVTYAQQPLVVDGAEITISESGERMYRDAVFTEQMITRYANGRQASVDEFVDGRRHGLSRKWFEDGVLGYESFYENGLREGVTRSWWFNGNLRSERFFVSGKSEGVAWMWYRNGNVFKRFNFVNGQPSGLQQAWRLNGKLFSNFEYKNGRVFGLRKSNNCVGLEDEEISVDYYSNQAAGL